MIYIRKTDQPEVPSVTTVTYREPQNFGVWRRVWRSVACGSLRGWWQLLLCSSWNCSDRANEPGSHEFNYFARTTVAMACCRTRSRTTINLCADGCCLHARTIGRPHPGQLVNLFKLEMEVFHSPIAEIATFRCRCFYRWEGNRSATSHSPEVRRCSFFSSATLDAF